MLLFVMSDKNYLSKTAHFPNIWLIRLSIILN